VLHQVLGQRVRLKHGAPNFVHHLQPAAHHCTMCATCRDRPSSYTLWGTLTAGYDLHTTRASAE
jgi:hypothetical protein